MQKIRGVMGGGRAEAGTRGKEMFANCGDDEGNSGGVSGCDIMEMVRGELCILSFDKMGDGCEWIRGWDLGTGTEKGNGKGIVEMH